MRHAHALNMMPASAALLLVFITCTAWSAAPTGGATVLRETTLFAADDFAAERLAQLTPGTRLVVYGRRGLWLEVAHMDDDARRGHVRLTSVRMSGRIASNDTDSGSGLARLSRSISGLLGGFGRREEPKTYDTLGIRGLTPAELETAAFNGVAMQALVAAAASADDARAFAAAGGLAARDVGELDASAGSTP